MFNNHFSKFLILSLLVCGFIFTISPVPIEAHLLWATPGPTEVANIISVTTTADVLNPLDGQCSLREAVISANTNPPPKEFPVDGECNEGMDTVTDMILLSSGKTYFLTLAGNGEDASKTGDLDLANNSAERDIAFVVSGDKTDRPIIDASGLGDRVFEIGDPTVSFSHIAIQKGVTNQSGAGIYNHLGKVNLQDTVIEQMEGNNGAGIFNEAGTIFLTESYIVSNKAMVGEGGAIFNGPDGEIHLSNSDVIGNEALNGAGIFNVGMLAFSDGSRIVANKASQKGGGIYNVGGSISGSDVWIDHNESILMGGGIFNLKAGDIDLETAYIFENVADDTGSGIYNEASKIQLTNSSVSNHHRNSGIFNKGDLTLVGTIVFNNVGGGIVSEGGTVKLLQTHVYDNNNRFGGGVYLTAGAKATIHQSAIYNNLASLTGGGIYMSQSSLEMINSTVSGNSTGLGIGGGIHLHSGFEGHLIRFYNVTIADNYSKSKKGSALSFISKNIDIEMVNTILTGPDDQTVCQYGTIRSQGSNIVSDDSCLAVLETGDQITSPLLRPLDVIGETKGHMPELNSPAFGNGNSAVCAAAPVSGIDQRGLAREYGCDIGAIELLQAPPPATETPVPSETPITTATPQPGETPVATATPKPGETPIATATPKPGETPIATATPKPGETPGPGTGEPTYRLFLPLAVKN